MPMKASEIVESLYQKYIRGKIGPRAVGALKGEMLASARKGGPKAAAKKAIEAFKKYDKEVPIALSKIAKGTKTLEPIAAEAEDDDDDETPAKKSGLKKKKVAAKPQKAAKEEHKNSIGKMPAGVVLKPAIITIRPSKLEKPALRMILKSNRIPYDKTDDEDTLRAKLVKVLKKAATLPVVDYSKMDASNEVVKSGSCYGVLVDLAGSLDCLICPTQVECVKQFQINLQSAAKPAVAEAEEEEEESDEEEAAEEEEEAESEAEGEEDEEEEEAEGEDEDAEVAEEDAAEEEEEAEGEEEEEAEGEEDEEEEEAEGEEGEEEEETDEDVEEEEDDEEEGKKKPAKAAKKATAYEDDTVIKLLKADPPVEKSEDLYEPLKAFLKGAPKKVKYSALKKMLKENFNATDDEIESAAGDLVTQLIEEKVARVLTEA